jgi:cytochrome c oxidase subunit IV
MHLKWERPALNYALTLPVAALLVFVAIMAFESEYTEVVRVYFFGNEIPEGAILPPVHH